MDSADDIYESEEDFRNYWLCFVPYNSSIKRHGVSCCVCRFIRECSEKKL